MNLGRHFSNAIAASPLSAGLVVVRATETRAFRRVDRENRDQPSRISTHTFSRGRGRSKTHEFICKELAIA
jgi:hypothetical protein